MKFFLISDNVDTKVGMRLAGIEGVLVHKEEEVKSQLNKAMHDKDIGVILITSKLVELCRDFIYETKLKKKDPLIVEIPDRHGKSEGSLNISEYVKNAIGINI